MFDKLLGKKKVLYVVNRTAKQVKWVVTRVAGGYFKGFEVGGQAGAAGMTLAGTVKLLDYVPGTKEPQHDFLEGVQGGAGDSVATVFFSGKVHVTVKYPYFNAGDEQQAHPLYDDPKYSAGIDVGDNETCVQVMSLPLR